MIKDEVRITVELVEGIAFDLTLDEARKLRDILVDALGEKKQTYWDKIYNPNPIPCTPSPIWIDDSNRPNYQYPTITCSDIPNHSDNKIR